MTCNKLILVILLNLAFSIQLYAEKRALIIAIGDYPDEVAWQDIASENDVEYIEAALLDRGFARNKISILKNAAATRIGILNAFEELYTDLKKGDMVMIHFSGHGQQVVDDNGDEVDGLDEAIVPYDSPLYFVEGVYEGENLVRDDEIGNLTNKMRSKIGAKGQLILVLDSCHSGTGTRGRGKARGTDRIMGDPERIKDEKEKNYGISESRGAGENIAPMASFFGASPHQLNYEYIDENSKSIGSLSYAFSVVLTNINKGITFEELFERIKLKMATIAPQQTPQWEGDKNQILLDSGKEEGVKLYNVVDRLSANRVRSNFGYLNGIGVGTEVEILDMNSTKSITKGIAELVSINSSVVKLETDFKPEEGVLYKLRIVQKASGKIKSLINADLKKDSPWASMIQKLEEQGLCELVEHEANLYIIENPDNSNLSLQTKEGEELYSVDSKKNLIFVMNKFANHIRAYSQTQFLRTYESPSLAYNLDFDLIPVEVDENKREVIASQKINSFVDENGTIQFREGDNIKIKITNNGSLPAYYSIIDIQPDHKISVLVPGGSHTAEDYYIEPGQSQETDYYLTIYPPYGRDVLKLIASDKPLNLNNLLLSEGHATRGVNDFHPFEKLIQYSFQNESTRGGRPVTVSPAQVGTKTLTYEILAN